MIGQSSLGANGLPMFTSSSIQMAHREKLGMPVVLTTQMPSRLTLSTHGYPISAIFIIGKPGFQLEMAGV